MSLMISQGQINLINTVGGLLTVTRGYDRSKLIFEADGRWEAERSHQPVVTLMCEGTINGGVFVLNFNVVRPVYVDISQRRKLFRPFLKLMIWVREDDWHLWRYLMAWREPRSREWFDNFSSGINPVAGPGVRDRTSNKSNGIDVESKDVPIPIESGVSRSGGIVIGEAREGIKLSRMMAGIGSCLATFAVGWNPVGDHIDGNSIMKSTMSPMQTKGPLMAAKAWKNGTRGPGIVHSEIRRCDSNIIWRIWVKAVP